MSKKSIRRFQMSWALDQVKISNPVAKAAYERMRKQIRGTEIQISNPIAKEAYENMREQIRSGKEMQVRSFAKAPGKEVQKEVTESPQEKWSVFSMLKSFIQKVKRKNVA